MRCFEVPGLVYTYRCATEPFVEEGGRQSTRWARRIVTERFAVLEKACMRLDVDVRPFPKELRLFARCGVKKVHGLMLTLIQRQMYSHFNPFLERAYHELNDLTMFLNDVIAKLNSDFVKPSHLRKSPAVQGGLRKKPAVHLVRR